MSVREAPEGREEMRKYSRDRKPVEVERRRHGARREAEGYAKKRHLRTDGSEQLISSSRFTVSLPRPTK